MNSNEILQKYQSHSHFEEISQFLSQQNSQRKIHLKGLIGSSDAFMALSLFYKVDKSLFFLMSSYEEAVYFMNDLENISGLRVLLFPSSFKKDFDFTSPNPANVLLRAEVLSEIKNTKSSKLIVSYPEAWCEKVISAKALEQNTLEIRVGEVFSVDFINEFLNLYDFERTDFVYEAGQFAIRGGIIDIFSFSNERPYRLELSGDTIESIRTFDPEDQLSINQLKKITLVPNVQSKLLKENNISFLDFIEPDKSIIWLKDSAILLDTLETGFKKSKALFQQLSAEERNAHPEWMDPEFSCVNGKYVREILQNFPLVEFGKQFYFNADNEYFFNTKPQPSFNKDFTLLGQALVKNENQNIHNLIFADSAKQVERLYAIMDDLGTPNLSSSPLFSVINLSIREGFQDEDLKIACFTDHQIFDRYYKYRLKKGYSKTQAITLKELRELQPGDFVIHIDHGIGKYAGLEKIQVNDKIQESIRLIYADNDLLYVNINSLNRISKFTGKEGTEPKLSKLGTDAWEKLKKSTKKKVKDIARELIRLYALRKAKKGFAYSPDTYLQTELEASFIYEDTPDQVKATADFKKDMENPHPMDRLICGDVGFGKTEIAIRAAFKAVADGKQVAILVPTTILASQHYRTFKERLIEFPCTVDYVNRFKSAREIKNTLSNLALGKVDILVGTHRIVSKDVKFKDLGLLIIDEEQKFGVGTKEKLKEIRINVDTLTLTATPIPRTLHFSLMGARDLSIINTPPPNRQPVVTELHIFNEAIIKDSIEFEIDRGGQVFFVHNRVMDIYEIAGMIQKIVPHARVGVGHGQMEGDQLEEVMQSFIIGNYDVLVATTIIESGLDISNANTILINHAHHFGLSDLHQMRGRVGRSNRRAFCYLLSPPLSTLTSEARKRLSAVEEFSDLGSGFNIAMRDLDIRGAGNLLGAEQSGFIAEIGYEMYHKILDEAVQELKNDEFKDLFENTPPRPYISFTQIDTDQELLIPDEYVTSPTERYNLYNAMSKLENEEELNLFKRSLLDRFGPVPRQVLELIKTIRLQWLSKELGFEKVILKGGLLKAYFISEKNSPYFDSPVFLRILHFVQTQGTRFKLREQVSSLTLVISGVRSIHEAHEIFNAILPESLAVINAS